MADQEDEALRRTMLLLNAIVWLSVIAASLWIVKLLS